MMSSTTAATVDDPPCVPASTPAFATIYRDHVGHVWRTLRRLGVVERDLEDATHEVFLVVHRRLDTYDPQRPLRPWLTGIAWRVAADERRKARHTREQMNGGEGLAAHADPGVGPEGHLAKAEARAMVARGLEALDLDRRVVFVMYEIDGSTGREIAEALEIPLFTVFSRLRSARSRFKKAIKAMERGS
ncbi:MAG: RNA polymerase sigma factor [Bradymonadia bacterium]